jgi:hypothetical protein
MEKRDLKKEFAAFYKPQAGRIEIVQVPPFPFLMIDGIDARPESPGFSEAISALFALSYKLKFISKLELGRDYSVMPLEGLWWADDMDDYTSGRKEAWRWTLMIHQPGWIDSDILSRSVDETLKKKPELETSLSKARLEIYKEGLSAQSLHIGPYSDEAPLIARMHQRISEEGGRFEGEAERYKHHEIYLSDFRRSAPEKLKTVLRQPFANPGA